MAQNRPPPTPVTCSYDNSSASFGLYKTFLNGTQTDAQETPLHGIRQIYFSVLRVAETFYCYFLRRFVLYRLLGQQAPFVGTNPQFTNPTQWIHTASNSTTADFQNCKKCWFKYRSFFELINLCTSNFKTNPPPPQ